MNLISKEQLLAHIHNGLSTREIGQKTNKSQTNVRFWLNKFSLSTNPKFGYQQKEKFCSMCQTIKPIGDFYTKRDKNYPNKYPLSYCISCTSIQAVERQRELKKTAIEHKGGKCQKCGYNKCQAALEFHHLKPEEKDFAISRCKNNSFEKVKKELDKCILICSNCHKEEHWFQKDGADGEI